MTRQPPFPAAKPALIAAPMLAGLALAGCATTSGASAERVGMAQLYRADGAPAGTAQLLRDGDIVELAMVATGLTPGMHGFHLHQTGQCDAPDFKSAGGHLNPTNREHGLENPEGPHFGDLPNLNVPQSGAVSTTVKLRGTAEQALGYIFDADGTAIVIHAMADDNMSNPAGDAGSRAVCGVIERS